MGYPNPHESPYDLFMTGHAGASVSCALGLKTADDLLGHEGRTVAVIGDGALPSGIVFEAMNNAAGLGKDLLVILNDNKMSICPRVGGLARYLDRARMAPLYTELKRDVQWLLGKVPVLGDPVATLLANAKDALKASLHGGMLFEEMGLRYIGPIDGHDLASLREYLENLKDAPGPILLHVLTEKGHGFGPASEDPVTFHTPPPFEREHDHVISVKKGSSRAYTNVASDAIYAALERDERVVAITAAMCQGNKLDKVRDTFPDRFFDTGICESHAVAFAAGLAKNGARPIVAIYSTFLQRAFDQLFQEVALQHLPVTFCLDRAGLTGPDGPTHHGVFDTVYLRLFPNFVVMAPGDECDLPAMLEFALDHNGPAALRYPKTSVERFERHVAPVELGQAEVIEWGHDGMLLAYGTLLGSCLKAAEQLRREGFDVGVVNARFAKPLDRETMLRAVEQCPFVVTVEEGTLEGGFGSAVLEAANNAGISATHVRRLGIPDRFVEHAERGELLSDLGLDPAGIAAAARRMAEQAGLTLRSGEQGKRAG
jgi:1-deoxy-D-xylulose-5-phosphate synthase